MNALVRHNYAGVVVLQQSGVCELYENGVLLARTDNTAIADKLFFKRAFEIASTRVGVGARARLTAEGRRAFGCEGTPSPSEGGKGDDNPSTADAGSDTSSVTAGAVPPSPRGEGKGEEKPKRAVFKKPTVEEIGEYCRERGDTLTDPQAFYDYHESGGWMVGRKKMQDWKAAVRTWERKERERQKERAAREKLFERSRKGVELTNPEHSSLNLEEFERDALKWRPKFIKPTERNEAG